MQEGKASRPLLSAVLQFCLSAVSLAACSRPAATPPNILLVTLDTTRADHIGAYGDARARTPRLDALAADGVLFEHAVSTAPITLPAHVSLLTGSYPFVHGVRNNGNFGLSERTPTVATALHARGYRTAAFVSAFVLDRRFGLARGFDRYDDAVEPPSARGGELERRGDRTAAAAGEWLATSAGAPFFVWVHLYDPHDPYDPPPPYRESFAARPYDGEIAFDDSIVGSLLDRLKALGVATSTIVAVVGDHGESLGEHGEATHSLFVYESALHVPMIVAWPGHVPAGRRVGGLTRAIDLAPTLLELAGQPALDGADGRSLSVRMRRGDRGSESAYSETYFPLFYMNWAPLRSLQDGRWKFIDAPVPELYDLANDPHESRNLAPVEGGRVAAFSRGLNQLTGGSAGAMAERQIDRETAGKLAALGYIGASGVGQASNTSPVTVGHRPDPKAMIGVFNALRAANSALQQGHAADGERLARQALRDDPDNAFASFVLGQAQMDQGRYRDAVAAFRRYGRLVPSSADAHHRAAIGLSRSGDAAAALAEEEAALTIDPRDAEAHELRGGLLAVAGRIDEAIRELRAAVEIEPATPSFRIGLARVLIRARRLDEAQREIERALALNANDADAQAARGALSIARGDLPGAAEDYRRALAARPDADDVRLDLADTLDRLGSTKEAQAEYRRLATAAETPSDIRREARKRLR